MKKKTVTVGIPAHNEEKNIARLIDGILAQKGDNFSIKKVIVACDGCTDRTAAIVKKCGKKKGAAVVQCIDDGRRIGTARRMSEFYRSLTTDLFITFDADVTLAHDSVIAEIVRQFDDPAVGLVGGQEIPVAQSTVVGKSLEAYELFWRLMIERVAGGNNIHHAPGCVSAGTKKLLKSVSYPADVQGHDHFLFFEAVRRGYAFRYARNAVVHYKVPSTLNDFLNQSTRYRDSAEYVRTHFGDWTRKYYHIPVDAKLNAYLAAFIMNPVFLSGSIVLQMILAMSRMLSNKPADHVVWSTVKTSK